MNRDERRTRAEEIPPRRSGGGDLPSWLGPADSAKGGTWLGANDRGVIACLLNAYAPEDLALLGRDDLPSRGEIIPELMAQQPAELRNWLREDLDPSRYPSFTLVVVAAAWGEVYEWRLGRGVSTTPVSDGWSMITSSLWRAEEVPAWRRQRFGEWLAAGAPEVAGVPSFNLLEVPDRREWSPMMARPISITRSVTVAETLTARGELTMRYWRRDGECPVDPERPTASERLELAMERDVSP
jgi:hypothetical protein